MKTDITKARASQSPSMKGFDAEFTDFVDYILRITDRIWKDKNIGSITRYYSADVVIHTLGGPVQGSDAVINGTIKTLAAFPDRLLNAEDVIWSGNEEDGFYSSHRIISPNMSNLGHSEFGPPTGKQATVRTIADCAAKDNQIYEEWLMRDNLGLVQQLGFDAHEVAQRLVQENNDNGALHCWLSAEIERVRQAPSVEVFSSLPDPHSDLRSFVHCVFQNIWCERKLDIIDTVYSASTRFHGPAGRELQGHAGLKHYAAEILNTLSNPRVSIDHICSVARDNNQVEVAIRWTLVGRHDQQGIYGSPTGKEILILAASHWHIDNDLIAEEWTVFDELAVLRQIYSDS